MSNNVPSSGSPTVVLVIVTLAVVTSFFGANWYAQRAAERIDAEAIRIASDTAPTVASYSGIWRDIHRLDSQTSPLLGRPEHPPFERTKERLRDALAADVPLQASARERELRAEVRASVAALIAVDDVILGRLDAGDVPGAREMRLHERVPAAARADSAVEQFVTLEAAFAHQAGEHIRALRMHAARISYVLDTISALLATAFVILAAKSARRYASLLDERNRLAEERATELEKFADRVAHDLRGPLQNFILGLSTLQSRTSYDERSRGLFAVLLRGCHRMTDLIDGLLDFARAGGRPAPGAWADLTDVLACVVDDVREEAAAAGASLEAEPFTPQAVACAPGALTSVIGNLVRNAIKYVAAVGPDDRRVTVRVREHEEMVHVEVEDNGPGIPEGDQRRVFDPYVRAGNTKKPGIGLGLATVKRVVEAHGGTVGVESKLGLGARFWFELPKGRAGLMPLVDRHPPLVG